MEESNVISLKKVNTNRAIEEYRAFKKKFTTSFLFEKYGTFDAPAYLLLPLGKWGLKWGDFHWAINGGVFNHEKGAIWQSHLVAQKEGVVTTIIFSNHKTY